MNRKLSTLAFSRLKVAPPSGTIQFYDGFFPALTANTYNISVDHVVTPPTGDAPKYSLAQTFIVQAPEFTIDSSIIETVFPANGTSAILDQQLPYLVLTDPSLPWERSLVPGQDQPTPSNPTAWLALLIFAEGEIYLQPGSNNPVATSTVKNLLAADPNVLKPQLPDGWVSQDLLNSQCQSIKIPGTTFASVMPSLTDLPFLSHCRTVNTPNEDPALVSVLVANRLPVANTTVSPAAPLRYYAHLVSLEGFASYLGPNGQPIPDKPDGGLMDVQLVSLFNWTFISLPETGLSFEALIQGLIDSEKATPVLSLPVPADAKPPEVVAARLQEGYAPLTFVSGSGEQSYAWYRGPLSAVVPQPLPAVGEPKQAVRNANSADELMIYLAAQGLFDLSYAAAWNIGRELALADSNFALAVTRYRIAARSALNLLAQRSSMPHLAGQSPRQLLASDASKRRFSQLVGSGLGKEWNQALRQLRDSNRSVMHPHRAPRRIQRRATHPTEWLEREDVVRALGEYLDASTDPITAWLANLTNLSMLPFSYLVPDPRMLPVESIRFFYVDPAWIDALLAGALSIATHNSADIATLTALMSSLKRKIAEKRNASLRRKFAGSASTTSNDITISGVLIRSEIISSWPTLAIAATAGGSPVDIVRDDTLAPNVRLLLFKGIPDTINIAEPYQGLQFGVEDNGIAPRYVTSKGEIGAQIPGIPTVPPGGYSQFLSEYCRTSSGGVVQVASLAAALRTATDGGSDFGAGDFAIQIVRAPELQSFTSSTPGK